MDKTAMMAKMKENMTPGVESPSGKYWCVMCKKFFELEEPVCPYMTDMCINTPLAVESLPPGSTLAYERIGLYYPKIAQKVQAALLTGLGDDNNTLIQLGHQLPQEYLAELAEWNVNYSDNPLEAAKSFLIYFSGSDVATRLGEQGITFLLVDASIIWGEEMPAKKRLKKLLLAAVKALSEKIGLEGPFDLHMMDVMSAEPGRFYCSKCSMLFEFGQKADTVTCPFMPQKCRFKPHGLREKEVVDFEVIDKILEISPKLYLRNITAVRNAVEASGDDGMQKALIAVKGVLAQELAGWHTEATEENISRLAAKLGLVAT